MKINCVIIDDNEANIIEISEYVEKTSKLNLLQAFIDPVKALSFVKSTPDVNLIILDINMPYVNGIELSILLKNKSNKIIFATSHAKYALDAFEVAADGFLLKPFGYAKFLKTIQNLYPDDQDIFREHKEDFLFVKSKEENLKIVKIKFTDIVVIESMLNYVKIHTLFDKHVTHISLKEIKKILSYRHEFVQLHRSFIVSKQHIQTINGNNIFMSTGFMLSIGENYKVLLDSFLLPNLLKPGFGKTV